MGRLKEAVGFSGRGQWVDATSREPCPICGATSWCGVSSDGALVLCKRVEGERQGVTRDGVTFYVHHLNATVARSTVLSVRPIVRERASVDVCDRAYHTMLAQLRLDDADHRALEARGLDADAIRTNEYRSLRVEGRARLARAVIEAVGEEAAAAVPGIVWHTEGHHGWWSLAGSPGILVPVRDVHGRVVALKLRRSSLCDGPRYVYLSSAKRGGASAANEVHVPLAARALREGAERLVVTEGELKADVATHLARTPVVSVPGVGSWASSVDLAKSWGASVIAIAFDMDATEKKDVATARRLLCEALRREGLDVQLLRWDRHFKGLDDVLLARRDGVQCHAGR